MVKKYTDAQLLERVRQLASFKRIPTDRWILGVRSQADLPGKFDDKFYEFEGEKCIRVLTGTTHPGITILKGFDKYSHLGAAILKSDEWYYDVWKFGQHKGKIPALLQLGAPFKVYRDNDRDDKAEEIGKVYSGFFGINYHTNTYNLSEANQAVEIDDILAWSAGCQVPNERDEYVRQMKYYEEAARTGKQTSVTYCLIREF